MYLGVGVCLCVRLVWRIPPLFNAHTLSATMIHHRLLKQKPSSNTANLKHPNLQGYRIKPHGQLVLVSCAHYCASIPSLSTSWSRTTLQGGQAPGIPNLQTSFPLRCLQRLSLPYIATRQCHWHDNRYTSGTSTPVLSYSSAEHTSE